MDLSLVADIGGTNARFALAHELAGQRPVIKNVEFLKCRDFENIEQAIDIYLKSIANEGPVEHACMAIAAPIKGSAFHFTNNHWVLDIDEISKRFSFNTVLIINDYEAIAHSLSLLCETEIFNVGTWKNLDAGQSQKVEKYIVMGPGTGFGAAGIIVKNKQREIVVTEAGHVGFAPANDEDIEILRILMRKHHRVTIEHLLSGAGIVNLYQAFAALENDVIESLSDEQICRSAISGSSALCKKTMNYFCRILGTVAGDLALATGARNGVYLAGGILPRYRELLVQSDFRQAFEDKETFSQYMSSIPTRLISYSTPGLLGASIYLARELGHVK